MLSTESSRHAPRADIQALRAVAVALVVLYHFWPNAIPGGYVGVDVFFVISGFLITAQLVESLGRDGARGLGPFWVRRLRRLLPASLLVLAASALAVWWVGPAQDQVLHLRAIIASSLYVSNWQFAADAVDYLGAENAPTVAQHFWSLSVEEQFYLFWPLFLLLVMALTGRRRGGRLALLIAVATVGVLSLALCLALTSSNQPYAFFGTPARIWEFAVGGIIALTVARSSQRRLSPFIASVGLVAVVAAGFAYGDAVVFPGVAAMLPVAGAAAVIAAGIDPDAAILGRIVVWTPMQWVGDHSYGIYLWHWPLIVLAPAVLERTPTAAESFGLLGLCLLLAWITKRLVEDPIRFGTWGRRRPRLSTAAAVLVAVGLVAGTSQLMIDSLRDDARGRAEKSVKLLADPTACVGAALRLDTLCAGRVGIPVGVDQLIPSLGGLLEDTGGAYRCYSIDVEDGTTSCEFGSKRSDALRIAVTGDSHAAMLVPALETVAPARNWQITSIVGRGCVWGTFSATPAPKCRTYSRQLDRLIERGDFDVVLVAARNDAAQPAAARDAEARAMAGIWGASIDRGTSVVAVRDNPAARTDTPACLAAASSFDEQTCSVARTEAFATDDRLAMAQELEPRASLLDFTGAYCAERCSEVLGGVLVHRDQHHITASFSRTLAPFLAERLAAEIASERP